MILKGYNIDKSPTQSNETVYVSVLLDRSIKRNSVQFDLFRL